MVIMDTTESVGSLEEQALKRKERLKSLKRKNPSGDNTGSDGPGEIVPLPKPKFRSYKPQDESLKEAKMDDAEPVAVEDEVKDLIEAGKEKTGIGIPDYIQPDEVLDRVAAILGPTCEGYSRQFEEGDDSIIVIPPPSDEEEITAPIECVEVGVGDNNEACAIGITRTPREHNTDQPKRMFVPRTSGKLIHQNLMAKEVESRINRNNAIADYYAAKQKKIDEEYLLNRDILLLQKKKIELEILEIQKHKDSSVVKEKLLLEKKKIELQILETQKKKYSAAAALFRASSDGIQSG